MTVRVVCINKSGGYHEDPHHAISMFGWVADGTGKSGRTAREDMWRFVTDGGHAYVRDAAGSVAWLRALTSAHGTHFLQTESDGRLTDNLLYLPECR